MKGTRVLDLSTSVSGAYTGRLLAGMGAEVVLAEPQGGSPLRVASPMLDTAAGRCSPGWEYLSAYKSSALLTDADAVVEAAEAFHLVLLSDDGPAGPIAATAHGLRAAHPGLVVAAVTPFGLTGPYADWRAGPLELWALGGQMALTGEPDRHPLPGGGAWNSYLVGTTAAVAAQGALLRAAGCGRGALVDVGAMEALAAAHQWSIVLYTHNGYVKRRHGNRHGEMHHPLCLYACRDGWVCIAAASYHQWEGLCIAMGRVELLADDELAGAAARFDRADEIDRIITEWTNVHSVADVVEACQSHFCPAGPVTELVDVLGSEQLAFRRYWERAAHLGPAVVMPGVPFRLPCTPPFRPAPALGSSPLPAGPRPPLPPAVPLSGGQASTGVDRSPSEAAAVEPFAPLAGVRVLELTISWAGPLASRFLADLGADVVKIEHPTSRGVAVLAPDPDADPEPWEWGDLPPITVRNGTYPDADPGTEWWNRMGLWNKMNRSKRSLCLDIKGPGGREVFERLVATADIVINNYSPRGVRSLGIDHETLRAVKPDLVTVAMSGFGATGPGAEAVSWGPILDASSGLAATTGYADSGPYKQGLAYPDPVGGTHGAAAVLAAWWEHRRTGEAVHVDLSQLETLLAVAGDQVVETSVTGHSPARRGARSVTHAPAGVYRCVEDEDGDHWLALTVYDDSDWCRLAAVVPGLGRPEWVAVTRRHVDHDEIDRHVGAWTAGLTHREAMAQLQEAGVAAVMVSTNKDLVEDGHLASRRFMVTLEHASYGPRGFPGSPFLVDGHPLAVRAVSSLGADNEAVLRELGLSEADREALAAGGTIATAPPS